MKSMNLGKDITGFNRILDNSLENDTKFCYNTCGLCDHWKCNGKQNFYAYYIYKIRVKSIKSEIKPVFWKHKLLNASSSLLFSSNAKK